MEDRRKVPAGTDDIHGAEPPSTAWPWLTLVLVASFAFALFFLSIRNLYEDEFLSFRLINLSLGELWREANQHDMHPPGMYALSRFFYHLTVRHAG